MVLILSTKEADYFIGNNVKMLRCELMVQGKGENSKKIDTPKITPKHCEVF